MFRCRINKSFYSVITGCYDDVVNGPTWLKCDFKDERDVTHLFRDIAQNFLEGSSKYLRRDRHSSWMSRSEVERENARQTRKVDWPILQSMCIGTLQCRALFMKSFVWGNRKIRKQPELCSLFISIKPLRRGRKGEKGGVDKESSGCLCQHTWDMSFNYADLQESV